MMKGISTAFELIANLALVYMILLFLRLLSSWFSMDDGHPALRILGRICDPYLNWFRRFRWLSIGRFDFSPIVAILIISFANNLFQILAQTLTISLGIILSDVLHLLWGAVQFLLFFLIVLIVIRLLALWFHWQGQTIWNTLDSFLLPITAWFSKRVRRRGFTPYQTSLIIAGSVFLIILIGGTFALTWLVGACAGLPF